MLFHVYAGRKLEQINASSLAALCPHCSHTAVLFPLGKDWLLSGPDGLDVLCGHRLCPNPECRAHLFVVSENGNIVASYPPVRIDFSGDKVPDAIRKTFEEALDCEANGAFTASAIMIRRTLEEVCADRKATGPDLKARIKNLKSKVVLPTELFEAIDELRILGNDATHVQARAYASIGKEELATAIEFTKEILKALYQYTTLLERLRSLKGPEKPTPRNGQ